MSKIKNCSTCQNEVLKKIDKAAQHKCDDCLSTTCCGKAITNPTQYEPFEFHVGDYVELNDGSIGYIQQIDNFDDFYHVYINLSKGGTNCECHCKRIDFYKYFKRIGKYNFTETQSKVKKIEHLPYEKIAEARGGKDNVVLKKFYLKLDQEEIIDKLNEVIDRVNEIGC